VFNPRILFHRRRDVAKLTKAKMAELDAYAARETEKILALAGETERAEDCPPTIAPMMPSRM
jgi:hypothetical protein